MELRDKIEILKVKISQERAEAERMAVRIENAGNLDGARYSTGRFWALSDVLRWMEDSIDRTSDGK